MYRISLFFKINMGFKTMCILYKWSCWKKLLRKILMKINTYLTKSNIFIIWDFFSP